MVEHGGTCEQGVVHASKVDEEMANQEEVQAEAHGEFFESLWVYSLVEVVVWRRNRKKGEQSL